MKIALNLAIPPSAQERYAPVWAIPATLLGIAGLVFLLTSSNRMFREYKSVQKSLIAHQAREKALRDQEAALRRQLEEPQSRGLLKDVQFVNGLIEEKRFSVAGMVADITDLMPDEVRLSALALTSENQELGVRFVVTAKNEEAVERFLADLEDSPHFKDVAIIKQGFEETGATAQLENIACFAHYLPGTDEDSGE